ncbi:MAG: ABC transporter substrate-binding protein [Candidatus Bathyarchaeia archaeon]
MREKGIARLTLVLIIIAIVIIAAVAAVVYVYFIAPPAPVPTIKIGAPVAQTGPLSGFGMGYGWGWKAAVDDINAQGGIYVAEYGRKLPVELIIRNTESDWEKASMVATDLILKDGVHALVAWEPTIPVYLVAEKYHIPAVGTTPFEPFWAHGPYSYSWNFAVSIAAELYPRQLGYTVREAFFKYTDMFANQTNRVVAVLACADPDGEGWYRTFGSMLIEAGYYPLIENDLGLFPPGTTDFSSIIMEWKAAGAEILWGNLPGPYFGIALRQMKELGFKPKIIAVGRAALFYEDVSAWGGNLPYGVGSEVWWSPYYPPERFPGIGGTTPMSLYERWVEETGMPLNRAIGVAYAHIQILADAIERAGSLDPEKINAALAETYLETIAGHVDFRDIRGEYHTCPLPTTFGQWVPVEGWPYWEQKIVFSELDFIPVEHDPVFPKPWD